MANAIRGRRPRRAGRRKPPSMRGGAIRGRVDGSRKVGRKPAGGNLVDDVIGKIGGGQQKRDTLLSRFNQTPTKSATTSVQSSIDQLQKALDAAPDQTTKNSIQSQLTQLLRNESNATATVHRRYKRLPPAGRRNTRRKAVLRKLRNMP